jgi:hypothetical protein
MDRMLSHTNQLYLLISYFFKINVNFILYYKLRRLNFSLFFRSSDYDFVCIYHPLLVLYMSRPT